jgi:protein gp37
MRRKAMNEQKAPGGIEWTRIPRPDGTLRKGYTWNPLTGCLHGCAWRMPDGRQAECYAKTVAERLATSAYPGGFATVRFHADRLDAPLTLTEPSGIFAGSMTDLFGHWVPRHQLLPILDVMEAASAQTFFLLTKNAPRLTQFRFPPNVWVGASSPPDVMYGQPLTRSQQAAMLCRSLGVLSGTTAAVRWMSFEPLSWDCADLVWRSANALDWAVIGAASHGRTHYPPDERTLRRLLDVLDGAAVPTFFKGNLRSLPWARDHWRDAFPVLG